ncbi:1-deoxy-D-xylulose-5-phosphate reductoisomerase [Aliiruegeria sabulilitoris]|uniref:1-deoxy-D-xylulose-5-phosphate reductoisomerase n=1 Tax=Aliiruegeria sabulilitoris TaxID=1510458 RepID=UPI000835712B|nr:1-deoxy-D-xylulose-5-phosphate reductoisomerase [Aliiruegeria sabulilitoris]NDR55067.1 1-deoxy-D-xylulose-5-phosphate reductoisomerase [Pseudoruegeria sp. M32A2M]
MKRVSIFGSTGSIGENTVDLIARAPEEYEVVALSGGRNIARLAEQAISLNAKLAVTCFPEYKQDLAELLSGTGIEVAAGPMAIAEAAERPVDWVMSAIVGAAGLVPGLKALEQGATLALANKESLVCAGELLMRTARANKADVLPVDSEHSAVWQALVGEDISAVERVIITASGGAFRDWPLEDLPKATPEQASTHPNWDMGQRITVDSASMFNKSLELIETREFFGFDPRQIEVLVHPQSLVHALIGFNDGGLMAHVGPADMRHAIGYALHYPHRRSLPVERLDLARIGKLEFREPSEARWPALRLAREVMAMRGLAGAVFNAAKERAMDSFLAREIRFTDMAVVVEEVLSAMEGENALKCDRMCLEDVIETDHVARMRAAEAAARINMDA